MRQKEREGGGVKAKGKKGREKKGKKEEKDRSHGNRLPPPYPQNPI